MKKIITWIDLEGRYRVTSPAYGDENHKDKTEDEMIAVVIAKLKTRYSLPDDHVFKLVEDAVQRAKLADCCGQDFRWPVNVDSQGKRDGKDGAWEMDVDGTPKVNMPKARVIHMDNIRKVRDKQLKESDALLDVATEKGQGLERTRLLALRETLRDIPATFDLSGFTTPATLKDAWPVELL